MATVKVSRTTSCSRAINYAEPRATVKTGINCDIDYAKSEMKQIRTLYGKDDR
ncbi:TPA: relaxase/mobilization nuclease domain-containing protein, partial [Enterococcus faecium]